jgi:hypothetical protein
MNHSLLSADRNTHLKIVTVALIAAIAVVAVGITAHVSQGGATADAKSSLIVKAGKPATFTRSDSSTVR